ncbi:TonB-dependent receptor [Rhodothermus profundi]|uniref:TonB dependent receptor n=1 Tax=Rhodothermus profundi TaxID=633813 RepID=A0A1M6Q9Z4_9BACT|nr:TonB-dependent receptor [Rhodothermus profundi]SHK16960.1 TonB dependent receptor [Rhodothermus profundi]
MHRGCWFVLIGTLLLTGEAQAQPATISGFVRDAATGETLISANVVLQGTAYGTATNAAGFYTLTGVPPGTYTLAVSYLGYRRFQIELTLQPGERRRLDVALEPEPLKAEEVVVTATRTLEEARNLSVAQVETRLVQELPAAFEPDVFRTLQLLPGVKAASDYSSGLYVRGGSPDQTLILLDGTTVYNPTHVFGFFSTFNPDAIKDVRLYKGAYPAAYGGRLGSVLAVYNKDGNRNQTRGRLSIGMLASRLLLEGPYRWGSWMIAFRRSTIEPLLAVLRSQNVEGAPDRFYFYDLNSKLNIDASANDRLSLAFYAGMDALKLPFLEDSQLRVSYGNRTATVGWMHLFSEQLFASFRVTGSYYFSLPTFELAGTPFERTNTVTDWSVRGDFEYFPSDKHTLKLGYWGGLFRFRLRDRFDQEESMRAAIDALYGALYVQETFRPSVRWVLEGGVRLSYFGRGSYVRVEPRLSVEYRPRANLRLQAGYGRYYQYLTLISSELITAFDVWLTVDEGVRPAWGDQVVMGAKWEPAAGVQVELEAYYRTMRALFEFDPFLPDVAGLAYRDLFRVGDGYAYGVEVLVQRSVGRLTGLLGYTWGRTRRRFPGVNLDAQGRPQFYPPKYDRTHDLSLVLSYDLSRSWRLSTVFTYATGQAYTEPYGQYRLGRDPFGADTRNVILTPGYNNARLPAYHRLDVGLTRRGRFFGIADYTLQVQVLNAYARRNLWFYFFEFTREGEVRRNEVPQIPIPLPNLSFTLQF